MVFMLYTCYQFVNRPAIFHRISLLILNLWKEVQKLFSNEFLKINIRNSASGGIFLRNSGNRRYFFFQKTPLYGAMFPRKAEATATLLQVTENFPLLSSANAPLLQKNLGQMFGPGCFQLYSFDSFVN